MCTNWRTPEHECLQVAAALGQYHWWQHWVDPQEKSENFDWNKVPAVAKDDFRYKYSTALMLLGNAQNPAFAHPKLLGRCYDNIYYNGRFIGDLPARGKPPSEEQSKKIYTQEYQEVVTRIENVIDLTEESLSYSMVPTSLVNPDIVLPHALFQEHQGLPELPPGCNQEPREYKMDGAWGLVDLAWSQNTPIFHPDDIDCDLWFNQYPFQEGDDYEDDDEEDMEVESRPSGGAGEISMAPPANTRRTYQCLPATYSFESAQTPGLPQSTHTDTDTAMEMGGLSMAPGGPDLHRVTPRAAPLASQGTLSTPDLATTVTRGVAAAALQILERFARPPQVNEADHPPIDLAADAAIWEHFLRCLAATPRSMPTRQATSGRMSAFNRLGHQMMAPQEENLWVPQPEMTPRKVDRGRQPDKEQESQWARSQKCRSQSRPVVRLIPRGKGKREGEGKSSKVQVGIDWMTMGIQKPVSKSDSRHPSFKPDVSGTSSGQPPQMKSTLAKGSHRHTSGSHDRTSTQGGRSSHTVSDAQLGDPEKKELQDKSHQWIESWVKRLDPAGYMEEINSLRYFGRNAGCFALQIVAVADWGRRYMDVGLKYPIPTFPSFCSLLSQSPTRPGHKSPSNHHR